MDEFKATPNVSGDHMVSELRKEIRRTIEEIDKKVLTRCYELELLLPGYQSFLPEPKELRSDFLRHITSILASSDPQDKITRVLWQVYRDADDFDLDDFEIFCRSSELSAAINMTTEDWPEFSKEMTKANDCHKCSAGYSLQGLSIALFGEPISIEAAKQLSHLDDPEAFMSLYGVFMRQLHELVPEIE